MAACLARKDAGIVSRSVKIDDTSWTFAATLV
jgi:hypothetical protein